MDIRKFFKQLFEINIKFRIKQEKMQHKENVSSILNSPDFVDPYEKFLKEKAKLECEHDKIPSL